MAQTNVPSRLFIPFLDKTSQSNIVVTVCDFDPGQSCPLKYVNTLSNTNLFTPDEQRMIGEVLVKYKKITTNSGPSGTVLKELYPTNYVIRVAGRPVKIEDWIAHFAYTNFDAKEEIRFNRGGIIVKFRSKLNDGYNATFSRTGGGTLLTFREIHQDIKNSLFVRFDDNHPQGTNWDFKFASFNGEHLEEYQRLTNNLVFGKYLMWNPINGNLILESDFLEPYDFQKHRIDLKLLSNNQH
jgi:hypothetical protein